MSTHTSHSRLRKFITLGIIILVGIIGWQAWRAYDREFDTVYTYEPPFLIQNGTFTDQHNNSVTVPMKYFVRLNTTSLSAQNEINVDTKLFPDQNFVNYALEHSQILPSHIFLIFPDALKFPPDAGPEGRYTDGFIILNKTDDNTPNLHYYGSGKIYYQFEGENGYVLYDSSEGVKFGGKEEQKVTFLNATELKEHVNKDIKYSVGSSDLTATLKTNDIFLSLTLVLVGFGVIESKDALTRGIIWFYEHVPVKKVLCWIWHKILSDKNRLTN